MKITKALAGVAALGAAYLALAPRVNMLLYKNVLFHPDKYPVGDYHVEALGAVKRTDVYFASRNGTVLHGWYFKQAQAKKTILFSHGNGGNLTTRLGLVSMMLDAGASVFVYDFQGYGRSEGGPSPQKLCEDGLAAYRYLTETENVSPDQIIIYGESLGSGVASYLSSRVPAAALVLQSGFASLQRISGEHFPPLKIYPSWLFPKPSFNNVQLVQAEHPPLLVIHGVRDTVVPFSHAEDLFELASEPKAFVRLSNSDHIDIYLMDREQYVSGLNSFLNSLATPVTRAAAGRVDAVYESSGRPEESV